MKSFLTAFISGSKNVPKKNVFARLWYKSKAFISRWRTGDSVVAGQRKAKRRKCLATPGSDTVKENRGAKSRQKAR
jgi:hypothetical protein